MKESVLSGIWSGEKTPDIFKQRPLLFSLIKIFLSCTLVIIIAAFPVFYFYFRNVLLVDLSDVLLYILIYSGVALGVGAVVFLFTKSVCKSVIMAALFSVIFSNYRFFEDGIRHLIPTSYYWHIAPVVVVLFIHIIYLVAKKLSYITSKKVCVIISVSFLTLTLFNGVLAIPDINRKMRALDIEVPTVVFPVDSAVDQNELPNIYLIVVDEYSGFEAIERIYGYDNADFYKFLNTNSFTVSRNSHNESNSTAIVMNNLLNLDYIVQLGMSPDEIRQLSYPPLLYLLMEQHGYEIRGVGHTHMFYLPSVAVGTPVEHTALTIEGYDIERLLLGNTLLYPLLSTDHEHNLRDLELSTAAFMTSIEHLPNTPTFTFVYFIIPHQPFIFNRDGSSVHPKNFHNWADPQYYLGQFQFTTEILTEIVEFLIREDPDSIIILQSDHAARGIGQFTSHYTNYDIINILNAVYYRGEPIDEIQGHSGVNTLRLVLNRLLGTDFEILEVPRF